MPERKPIFYDEERRRWRRTRLLLEIGGAFFTLVLVVFMLNVGRNPELPDILRPDTRGLHAIRAKPKPKPPRSRKRKIAALGKVPQTYDPLRAAFYVSDDYTSLASLQLHYHDLDLLIPEALHAVSADGKLSGPGSQTQHLPAVAAGAHTARGNTGHVHGEQLRREAECVVSAGNAANAVQPGGAAESGAAARGIRGRGAPGRHRGGLRVVAEIEHGGFSTLRSRRGREPSRKKSEADGGAARRRL